MLFVFDIVYGKINSIHIQYITMKRMQVCKTHLHYGFYFDANMYMYITNWCDLYNFY